jgi:hypothetical protein
MVRISRADGSLGSGDVDSAPATPEPTRTFLGSGFTYAHETQVAAHGMASSLSGAMRC